MPSSLSNADLDEVSTVDVPAHQDALIVLAKRHQEAAVDFFDEDGNALDLEFDDDGNVTSEVDPGTVVFDGEGNAYAVGAADDEADYDGAEEQELAAVGKSAFFQDVDSGVEELFKSLSAELAKAQDEDAQQAILAKALSAHAGEIAKAQKKADDAEALAKALLDRQETAEYVEMAKQYNLPVTAEELGPVLKKCAERLSRAECAVLHKCLKDSGNLFKQLGVDGSDGAYYGEDILAEIDAKADAEMSKSGGEGLTREQRIAKFLTEHPDQYDRYERERQG